VAEFSGKEKVMLQQEEICINVEETEGNGAMTQRRKSERHRSFCSKSG
jgi:hypothetical protein